MNRFERMKQDKDGLDVLGDLPRFAAEGFESIPEDDLERLKWAGIFHRKPTRPYFMMRLRFPGGVASADQIRAVADLLDRYGRGIADLTTRQQIEPRWLRIEDMPAILEHLARADITSLQTGMDNIRGVVSCPLSGLYPHELLDASALCRQFQDLFVGNRAFTNLPRKFNVAITGCPHNCVETESQDLALIPAVRSAGGTPEVGFNVLVGGKMGSGGFTVAQPLDAFVSPEETVELCQAVVLAFRDHGLREARNHARLAFLIEQWGIERFRAAVQSRLRFDLRRAGQDARSDRQVDHLGVTPQRQPGLNAVGLLAPVGRVNSAQLREAARLAERYGCGELRLTPGQNLVVPGVPDAQLPVFLQEPLLREWSPDPPPTLRGLVACTGTDFCNLALIDTKARALQIADQLGDRVREGTVSIRWSGCPAGCGNHHSADIGLQGKRVRLPDGRVVEAVTILAGGRGGKGARPAHVVAEDVVCDERLAERVAAELAALSLPPGRREARAQEWVAASPDSVADPVGMGR